MRATRNWIQARRRARAAPNDDDDTEWRTDESVRRGQVAFVVVTCLLMAAAAVWGFSHGTGLVLEGSRRGPLPGWLVGCFASVFSVGAAAVAWQRRRRP